MKRQALLALFSINTFVAAMAALYIGFALGLPRPYWAMLTAYLISQPLSGAMRSRGVYRIFGTLLGASAVLFMVPPLANAPLLLSLALSLWIGLCVYLSVLDRTPRSYVFVLAGLTAAIIGFPTAAAPIGVFDTTIARVEETGLGVICATIAHSLIFPQAVGPAINRRIELWTADARRLAVDMLARRAPAATDQERRRLAADITEIRILASHLPFDTSRLKEVAGLIGSLQDRMSMVLPLLNVIGDRLELLRADGETHEALEAALEQVRLWVIDLVSPRSQAEAVIAQLRALSPPLGGGASWRDLVLENLLDRLEQYVRVSSDIRELRRAALAGKRPPPPLYNTTPLRGVAALHRDYVFALVSAVPVVVALLTCCALWIGLDWQEGSIAALTAGIISCLVAAQDDPAPAMGGFLRYTILAAPLLGLYQFVILPRLDGFPMLVLALAPALLAIGYFIANPKTMLKSAAVFIGFTTGLALGETFNAADFSSFANNTIAQIVGVGVALLATQLFRSVGYNWSARRILRTGWREIAEVAEASRVVDRTELTVRMLDRVGLLATRLGVSGDAPSPTTTDALGDVRVGLNIQVLRAAEHRLASGRAPTRRLLAGVAKGYRVLARAPAGFIQGVHLPELDARLLQDLDQALGEAAVHAPASPQMRSVACALVSLRRALFPQAPPYSPAERPA